MWVRGHLRAAFIFGEVRRMKLLAGLFKVIAS